jgi:hypothetical protein
MNQMDEKHQLPDGERKPPTPPLIWALIWSAAVGIALAILLPLLPKGDPSASWYVIGGLALGFTPLAAAIIYQRRKNR